MGVQPEGRLPRLARPPDKSALGKALEARNTLPREATSFIFKGLAFVDGKYSVNDKNGVPAETSAPQNIFRGT